MIKTREVVAHCPSIGRSSALAAFKRLTEEGLIIREGSGRSTFYVRADSKYFFQINADLDEKHYDWMKKHIGGTID